MPSEAPVPRMSTVRQAYPTACEVLLPLQDGAPSMEVLEVRLVDNERGHATGGFRQNQVGCQLRAVRKGNEQVLPLRDLEVPCPRFLLPCLDSNCRWVSIQDDP